MPRKYTESGGYKDSSPSGSYVSRSASGSTTKYSPSGYREETSPSGSKTITHPSGTKETYAPWSDWYTGRTSSSSESEEEYSSSSYSSKSKDAEKKPEEKPAEKRYETTKTELQGDNKEKLLEQHHKTKKIYGTHVYEFADSETGKKRWFAYPTPSVVKILDKETDRTEEFVVLGINDENNFDDWGRASMDTQGYLHSDVTLMYEVIFDEKGGATIDKENCYLVHIESGEIIPLNSKLHVQISKDGERIRVQNPFAPSTRFDVFSTRQENKMLKSNINPKEMF